jgi:microcystin-dependent protein
MSQPFVGEIRIFAGNFAPAGWAFCNGALLPISENETLFQLIGTTYGGDGQSTFALPQLQSSVPMHQGPGFTIGQSGGVEQVTLTISQIPIHTHPLLVPGAQANLPNPQGSLLGDGSGQFTPYHAAGTLAMNANSLANAGGSQPHENIQPYLAINFIISLFGVFPSQT